MTTTFCELIEEMRKIFAHDSVNIEEVEDALSAYKSRKQDWQKFAIFDKNHYTRNLVDTGNGKYNMIILCWGPGMRTKAHDHPGSNCFVKMLQGKLTETRFEFPEPSEEGAIEPLRKIEEITFGENEVTHINDSIGLHSMENPNPDEPAVSLHIYSPAFDECTMFDQQTSEKQVGKVTFWSKFGTIEEARPVEVVSSENNSCNPESAQQRLALDIDVNNNTVLTAQ